MKKSAENKFVKIVGWYAVLVSILSFLFILISYLYFFLFSSENYPPLFITLLIIIGFYTLFVSALGIIGGRLLLKKSKWAFIFSFLWSLFQIPFITFVYGPLTMSIKPVIVHLAVSFTSGNNTIGINLLGLVVAIILFQLKRKNKIK